MPDLIESTNAITKRSPRSIARPHREHRDLVSGPLRNTLFWVALPVLSEQILNTFVGMFDTFLAGRISVAATSAVGLAAYVAWLASMLMMLVGTGATAVIARHAGAREHDEANHFANQAVILALVLGGAISALMFTLAPQLARYSNLTGETYAIAVDFLRIDALGHFFLSLTLVGCACLRGVGDTRTPMLIFVVINSVNMLFSWGLVYGIGPLPTLGTRGIVCGTVIAQLVGAILTITVLTIGRSGLHLRFAELRLSKVRACRILRIGLPAGADGAVIWSGHFLFLAIVSHLALPPMSEVIFAAHVIAIRVEGLTYLPAFAFGTATATMIGHALGAGDKQRAKRAGYEGLMQCGLIALAMAAFYFFGAEFIYRSMNVDPRVWAVGVGPFRVLALFQPCLVLSIVLIGALRGAGDTRFPLLISICGSLFIRGSIGYLFGIRFGWGLIGAWMGMFSDMVWRAAAATWRFRSGAWMHTRV